MPLHQSHENGLEQIALAWAPQRACHLMKRNSPRGGTRPMWE
jgi:hypothetical protein